VLVDSKAITVELVTQLAPALRLAASSGRQQRKST
jgi:hypothetical protein